MAEIMREQGPDAVRASPMAAPNASFRTGFVIAGIAALFMTAIGALGTEHLPIPNRLGYWALLMGTGAFLGVGVSAGVSRWEMVSGRPVLACVLIASLIAAPLTIVVLAAGFVFFGSPIRGGIGIVYVFGIVFIVSAIITAVNQAFAARAAAMPVDAADLRPQADPAPPPVAAALPEPAPPASTFSDRLPHHLRTSPILALEADDHYLRVHCRDGSAMILMRLSDAILELGNIDGARTHRSWWVARDAVDNAQKTDGRAVLRLANQLEVPVSRTFVPSLTKANWFA